MRRPRLSPPARLALLWLTTTAAGRPGSITTTIGTIGNAIDYRPQAIRRALDELTAAGIITTESNNAGIRVRFCTVNNTSPPPTPETVAAIIRA